MADGQRRQPTQQTAAPGSGHTPRFLTGGRRVFCRAACLANKPPATPDRRTPLPPRQPGQHAPALNVLDQQGFHRHCRFVNGLFPVGARRLPGFLPAGRRGAASPARPYRRKSRPGSPCGRTGLPCASDHAPAHGSDKPWQAHPGNGRIPAIRSACPPGRHAAYLRPLWGKPALPATQAPWIVRHRPGPEGVPRGHNTPQPGTPQPALPVSIPAFVTAFVPAVRTLRLPLRHRPVRCRARLARTALRFFNNGLLCAPEPRCPAFAPPGQRRQGSPSACATGGAPAKLSAG